MREGSRVGSQDLSRGPRGTPPGPGRVQPEVDRGTVARSGGVIAAGRKRRADLEYRRGCLRGGEPLRPEKKVVPSMHARAIVRTVADLRCRIRQNRIARNR